MPATIGVSIPPALPDTSRVTFLIDYENGIVVARQNPSIRLDDGAVLTGRPDISVAQESNGKVHIKFNAADPFTPVLGETTKLADISVNGDLFYQPAADGGIRVGGTTGYYPGLGSESLRTRRRGHCRAAGSAARRQSAFACRSRTRYG